MPRSQQPGFAEAATSTSRAVGTQGEMVNEATLADEAMEEDVEQEGYGRWFTFCSEPRLTVRQLLRHPRPP